MAQVIQECPNSLQKPDNFSEHWQTAHVLCKGGHVCTYGLDVGLDLGIKEQNDRLRMTIEAFTKIFNYLSKCLKLGLLVNDPLQINRIPLNRISIHF